MFYEIEKWILRPRAAFQFSFAAMEDPEARRLMKLMIRRNATVLFGTGIHSYGMACYYEFDRLVQLSERYFNDYERDVLFFPKMKIKWESVNSLPASSGGTDHSVSPDSAR